MLRKQFAATAILACAAGTVFGYAPGTYTASYPGQNGDVPVSVTFSKDRIESVVVGENKETIGIGQTAVKNLRAASLRRSRLASTWFRALRFRASPS